MDQRTNFLLQALEKIGSPLTMAVVAMPGGDETGDARRVAELLNRSVQLGLTVADAMNVRDEAQADGVHLALASFSGPLIAGQYMTSGRVPGDLEIKRMAGALQAVMTFADGFTPAADTTLRLENMEPGSDHADEMQVHVQTLNAFAPMLQAVSQYTFGRSDQKLVQEVGAKIIARARAERVGIFGDAMNARQACRAELVLVRLMAGIYASAHMGEMARLMSLSESDRAKAMAGPGGVAMDRIWAAFDRQIEMMHVLAEHIVPSDAMDGGAASSSGGPVEAPQNITEKETVSAPIPPADPANPMSFFVRKQSESA